MLKPDGQLVLIDFGAVREVTETYLRRLEGKGCTAIISPGYTHQNKPMEERFPRLILCFGANLCSLLTGIHPHDLDQDTQTGHLCWRNSTLKISQDLADLIDQLMASLSSNRPRNAQEILQKIEKIEIKIKKGCFELILLI
jgi:serine/threonine protein kinase